MKKILALLMLLMFGLAAAEDIPLSPVVMLKGNPTTGYAWQAAVEAATQIAGESPSLV